ncbi:MAG TPA: cation:proton antiporter [Thermoplasmata archaeon]|nr:cation:proton antiporter [Thermoplasmata archaeon]
MADVWVFLLAGASLVLLGFAAAQVFDRFRIPDYFILMALGLLLGSGFLPLGGLDPRASLASVAPLLTSIALAFILFEGGLVLHVRGMGGVWAVAALHTAIAMALSMAGMWLVATQLLGLTSMTALILALAFCGPSATIVLGFLPRSGVEARTRFTLTVEGVVGNIVATILVILLVRLPADPAASLAWAPFLMNVGATVIVAFVAGEGWARAVRGPRPRSFAFMTSVALAVFLYAIGEGLLGGNGGLAAFVFGLVLGHRRVLLAPQPGAQGSRGLQEFHRELVFLLRTFFFLYLGLRVSLSGITENLLFAAIAFGMVFYISRLPSSIGLVRVWRLPPLDAGILRATVGRGMTDTVLILFAIEVGVIPPAEASFVTNLLFLVIVVAAALSAGLVMMAERTARSIASRRPALPPALPKAEGPSNQVPEQLDRAMAQFLDDPLVKRGQID